MDSHDHLPRPRPPIRQRERPKSSSNIDGSSPPVTDAAQPPPPEYEVGYRRPPKHSQFRPGQSGNPKGRPKGAKKSPYASFLEELQRTVPIRENGTLNEVTNLVGIFKRTIADAHAGKASATKHIYNLLPLFETLFATESEVTKLSPKDKELLLAMMQGYGDE